MDVHAPPTCSNDLLSALPPAEMAWLPPLLTRVRWDNGQGLHEAWKRIEHVFFVEQDFASMVAKTNGSHLGAEGGLIGREGLVGFPILLGPQVTSFQRAMVQAPGSALRMFAPALRDSLDALLVLRRLLFQALEVSMAHVAQTAACNGRPGL